MLTPFQFASNRPIDGIDLDGLEHFYTANGIYFGQGPDKNDNNRYLISSGIIDPKTGSIAAVYPIDGAGNPSTEYTKLYSSASQAAVTWLFEYQGVSHKTKFEHGVMIGSIKTGDEKGQNLTLYVLGSTATDNKEDGVTIDKSITIPGWDRKDFVHTHINSEDFSPEDDPLLPLYKGDLYQSKKNNLNMYLGTPLGKMKLAPAGTDRTFEYKKIQLPVSTSAYDKYMNKILGYNHGVNSYEGMPSLELRTWHDKKTGWESEFYVPKYPVPEIIDQPKEQKSSN